jgi:endoglucanase
VILFSAAGTGVIFFGIPVDNKARDGSDGFAFVERLGTGINLGHSLEAFGFSENGNYETSWENPMITKFLIENIAEAGFKSVRIPVTWAMRTGKAPEYTIDKIFMNRVQEVVDWVIGGGMIAVINMHHDDFYWYVPDGKHEKTITDQYVKMWSHIADRFEAYDERLVFEAFNEPRVVGSLTEWSGGTIFSREVLNRLNLEFVRTVRSAGGNNGSRFLFLPSYGGSIDNNAAIKGLKIPDDNRLIVSAHCYKPRDFATDRDMSAATFTDKDKKSVDKIFETLRDTFVSKGIPVVIGEFAAYDKDNEAERAKFAAYVVSRARAEKMAALWWDNGVNMRSLPDAFGILDRRSGLFKYPLIVKALT